MRVKQLLAACLCAALLGSAAPAALAAGSISGDARRADLNFLIEQLEQRHPDFYANVSQQQVADKKEQISKIADTLSDFEFAIEVVTLVNLAGDAHTTVSYGQTVQQARLLPFSMVRMDERWVLSAIPEENSDAIGCTVRAVAGVAVDEVFDRLSPVLRHENEATKLRDFMQLCYVFDILAHFGIVEKNAQTVELTLEDAAGATRTVALTAQTSESFAAVSFATAAGQRTSAAPTEYDRSIIYKALDLGQGAFYVQYNQCRQDEKLPMATFAQSVKEQMDGGTYRKLLIDLRNNGGGSDGVLRPILQLAEQFANNGGEVYALIGGKTFSSALINAAQLKQIGATLVGEPTGGSVDHFGEVTSFELPNSKLPVQHSNKFFKLSDLLPAMSGYGVESLRPDIACGQSFMDYSAGVDSVVERILGATRTAMPSNARVLAQQTQIKPAGYLIDGNNYYKLRDLAAALATTELHFSVSWDEKTKSIELVAGQPYRAIGGELQPLAGGEQVASRSQATLLVGGKPAAIAGYTIAGNNYYKLRDLCALLGATVSWEQASNTVTIA